MFGLGYLSKVHKLILGIFVLFMVDVIWVASSELTEYIFNQANYDKPYFSTYLKTSMFLLYMTGFLFWKSWWQQCRRSNSVLDHCQNDDNKTDCDQLLSEPIYVPVKSEDKHNGTDSDDDGHNRSVRFNNLSEVRQLSDIHAEEAKLARLSYTAYLRAEEARLRAASKLTVKQIAKLGFIFSIIFFFGNLAYQEALKSTEAGIVNVLSSTSGLFTLVLASIFPSSGSDRLTLSKFVAVLMSIGGVVMVSFSDSEKKMGIPVGALWGVCGALLYAIYLVLLRRRVDNEDKLNIPMFFGFVGFFSILLLWPGFFILHYTKAEKFEWPNKMQWVFLAINGLVGTVLSELLWLWGCFLTSSLIATLSLSLTIPMTMIADIAIKHVHYNWMFYVGTCPIFIAFFATTFLTHWENWDPVLLAIKKCMQCICRRRLITVPRMRDLDREQTESLIGINSEIGRVDT